jgi:hypothetical protein
VTIPVSLTRTIDGSELRHLRFGMLLADFAVPSAWRIIATN